LIHHIPPRPLYLRARIRQRLARIGAVALKNSVYLLPRSEECLEDFQWLAQEIVKGGGEAFLCDMSFVDPARERGVVEQFRDARAEDYDAIIGESRSAKSGEDPATRIARLRKQFEEIRSIDFFPTDRQKEVVRMLEKLESRRKEPKRGKGKAAALIGKTWVTRRGVKVDRISTAWMIRRFLDPNARFRLIDATAESKRTGEISFDMAQGDFTHDGDRCTFESLLREIGRRDGALEKVAQIVHDIDLKDGKYGRPETAGVRRLLEGILETSPDDDGRLSRGFELFDQLYESFRKSSSDSETPRKRTRKANAR
jgi:hypothetical protein